MPKAKAPPKGKGTSTRAARKQAAPEPETADTVNVLSEEYVEDSDMDDAKETPNTITNSTPKTIRKARSTKSIVTLAAFTNYAPAMMDLEYQRIRDSMNDKTIEGIFQDSRMQGYLAFLSRVIMLKNLNPGAEQRKIIASYIYRNRPDENECRMFGNELDKKIKNQKETTMNVLASNFVTLFKQFIFADENHDMVEILRQQLKRAQDGNPEAINPHTVTTATVIINQFIKPRPNLIPEFWAFILDCYAEGVLLDRDNVELLEYFTKLTGQMLYLIIKNFMHHPNAMQLFKRNCNLPDKEWPKPSEFMYPVFKSKYPDIQPPKGWPTIVIPDEYVNYVKRTLYTGALVRSVHHSKRESMKDVFKAAAIAGADPNSRTANPPPPPVTIPEDEFNSNDTIEILKWALIRMKKEREWIAMRRLQLKKRDATLRQQMELADREIQMSCEIATELANLEKDQINLPINFSDLKKLVAEGFSHNPTGSTTERYNPDGTVNPHHLIAVYLELAELMKGPKAPLADMPPDIPQTYNPNAADTSESDAESESSVVLLGSHPAAQTGTAPMMTNNRELGPEKRRPNSRERAHNDFQYQHQNRSPPEAQDDYYFHQTNRNTGDKVHEHLDRYREPRQSTQQNRRSDRRERSSSPSRNRQQQSSMHYNSMSNMPMPMMQNQAQMSQMMGFNPMMPFYPGMPGVQGMQHMYTPFGHNPTNPHMNQFAMPNHQQNHPMNQAFMMSMHNQNHSPPLHDQRFRSHDDESDRNRNVNEDPNDPRSTPLTQSFTRSRRNTVHRNITPNEHSQFKFLSNTGFTRISESPPGNSTSKNPRPHSPTPTEGRLTKAPRLSGDLTPRRREFSDTAEYPSSPTALNNMVQIKLEHAHEDGTTLTGTQDTVATNTITDNNTTTTNTTTSDDDNEDGTPDETYRLPDVEDSDD